MLGRAGEIREALAEAAQGGRLELADPLAREPELLADLLEARALDVAGKAEATLEDVPLPLRQLRHGLADALLLDRSTCGVDRILGGAIAEEIASSPSPSPIAWFRETDASTASSASCAWFGFSSVASASSSSVGGRPSFTSSACRVRRSFSRRSWTCTGIRIVSPWFATARWQDWRIHQVA